LIVCCAGSLACGADEKPRPPAPEQKGGPPGADEKARVFVVAIVATDQNNLIHPRLKRVAAEIQKVEPQLTGFQPANTTVLYLSPGKPEKCPLVDKEMAEILVLQGPDKDNRYSLKVKAPQMGEIVYSTTCGKFFPIVTRYQTMDKGRLIIAISVRPNRPGKEGHPRHHESERPKPDRKYSDR
jgi:hypothetical protein